MYMYINTQTNLPERFGNPEDSLDEEDFGLSMEEVLERKKDEIRLQEATAARLSMLQGENVIIDPRYVSYVYAYMEESWWSPPSRLSAHDDSLLLPFYTYK